jgi:hypothetical protein
MSPTDTHRIETVEELRAVIGEPMPLVALKVGTLIDDTVREFLARSPFLVLSTADAEGNQEASPKGDVAGFVAIDDDGSLLIPDRKGNKLVFGLQNILANPHVGVLFVIPGTPETLRVSGTAELTTDPAILERLAARGQPAVLAIRVTVGRWFFHCAKAFLRSQLWQPETWPPRHRLSFGRLFSAKIGGDTQMAETIDAAIATDYEQNL